MAGTSFNVLSLCAGIGGLDLGMSRAVHGSRTVCFVEWDAYAAACLLARMDDQALEPAPVYCGDLRAFDGSEWRGVVDCVVAGYPCQPFSHAGKRGGADDARHLWPAVARIIRECGAPVVVLENVPGHLSLGFDEVCGELQGMGYRIAAGVFSAAEVGATHRRERLFVVAAGGGGPVENSDRERGCCGPSGRGDAADVEAASGVLPAWPPAPAAGAEWAGVLGRFPWLAPAVAVADADD